VDVSAGCGRRGFCAPKGKREGKRLAVNKITWQKAGRVTEPGRYMFTFGWLTIAAADLAVWQQFPDAAFTLVPTATPTDAVEEFRLAAFELPPNLSHNNEN
jgi:hypothetical protein